MNARRVILLLLLVTMAGALFASQTPNTARGFSPGGTYHPLGIDTVNTFNGNLTLAIPIGQVYPIGGGLTYQLRLYANGNLWEAEDRVDLDPQTNGDCSPPPHTVPLPCMHAWPDRRANAGIGWTMSLGRLFPAYAPTNEKGWIYESPDGAEHEFFAQLWSATSDPNDSYTNDGTFLRMTVSGSERIVEFPNGEKHVFRANDDPSTTADDANAYLAPWYLDRITNRYSANVLQFTYDRANAKIVMSDGYRTQTIHYGLYDFEYGTIAPVNPSPSTALVNQRTLVNSIDVAAFGSQTGQYTFGYTQVSQQRPDWHNIPAAYAPYSATVQQLTSLTLPDGTSYAFTYWNITDAASGYPLTMKVPTGGAIKWTYENKAFPNSPGGGDWSERPYGVATRKLYDRDGTTLLGTWTYGFLLNGPLKVTITDPVGTKTESFFDVSSNDMAHPEYGLPVNEQVPDASGTRWLSQRTYLPGQSTPSRSTYHRYRLFFNGSLRELESKRTLYDDDAGVFSDTELADYDGVGHFRTVRTSGTDLQERVTTTQYNATSGTLPNFTVPAPSSPWLLNTYTERTVSENGTVLRAQYCFDANGFLTRRRQLKDIVPAPGVSLPAESGQDTVTVYAPDSRGNVAVEEYYGGDDQLLSTASLCGASLGSYVYRLNHTWSNGSLSTSQYAGATSFYVANDTIDANTGLASNSFDTTGEVSTAFTYDKMARLLTVEPEGRAWATYSYPNFSSTFEITEKQVPNGQPLATPLLSLKYVIDAAGRVDEEKVSMPGTSTESRRKTVYNALGWQMSVSELGNATTLPETVFTYDGYGRVKSITAPDTSVMNFTYTGVRQKTRTAKVSMSPTAADTLTSVVEKYDLYGRLVSVTESSGPTTATAPVGASVSTYYTYDPVDRMISVRMAGADRTTQFRRFDHDGRGFLRWESHPESGMTTYTYDARGHVLTKHQSAAGSLFDLQYTYDAAERPLTIKGRNPFYVPPPPDPKPPNYQPNPNQPQFRTMKSFSYATANNLSLSPPDYAKGKLASAARYNYDPSVPDGWRYKVEDQYSYRDAAGRKTNRRTVITRGAVIAETSWSLYKTIDTAIAYDDLDRTTAIDYPKCVGCAVPAHQNQTFTYDRGRLASATGFVTSMAYHPNGMWSAINRSNGMTDTQTLDSSGMARPGTISTELWDSCTRVTIGTQPAGGSITSSTPSVTMTVAAGGTAPLSSQWMAGGIDITGATGSSYTATPTVTTRYQVSIANACSTTLSDVALVSVNECEPPYGGASNKRNPNGTYTLSASDTGTQPLSYAWRRQGNSTIIGTTRTITIAAPSVNTTYTVTISNSCSGSPVTGSTTVILPLTMGTVQATRSGTTAVNVTWPASSGAAQYSVERRSGSTWGVVYTTSSLSFSETVTEGKTYAYRVRAVAGTVFSPYSNSDVATTIVFPQVTTGSALTGESVEPMLTAVNAVRAALGWPAVDWASILSSSDPSPAPSAAIRAAHVLTCRARMNEALQALGVPVSGYTDPDLVGGAIKAIHINQLTARTQ
jgi:hypothetical protein